MNFLKKIFGGKGENKSEEKSSDISPYMTPPELAVDEQFTFNFKKNGGKFLYCVNIEDLKEQFENILVENDWFESEVMCFEENLYDILDENRLIYNHANNPIFSFSTCESLIADEGSIMFSSNQFKHHKVTAVPDNMIVFAYTSQLRPDKGEGLSDITKKYKGNFPSNITTVKFFELDKKKDKDKDKDFLQYGSTQKNLYLLLLEDL